MRHIQFFLIFLFGLPLLGASPKIHTCEEILQLLSPLDDALFEVLTRTYADDLFRFHAVPAEIRAIYSDATLKFGKYSKDSVLGQEDAYLDLMTRAAEIYGYSVVKRFDRKRESSYLGLSAPESAPLSSLKNHFLRENKLGHHVILHPRSLLKAKSSFIVDLWATAIPPMALFLNRADPHLHHEQDHSRVIAGIRLGRAGLLGGVFKWGAGSDLATLFPDFKRTIYSRDPSEILFVHEIAAIAASLSEAMSEVGTIPFSSDANRLFHFRESVLKYVVDARFLASGLHAIHTHFQRAFENGELTLHSSGEDQLYRGRLTWVQLYDSKNDLALFLPIPRGANTDDSSYPAIGKVTNDQAWKVLNGSTDLIAQMDRQFQVILRFFLPRISAADLFREGMSKEALRRELTGSHLREQIKNGRDKLIEVVRELHSLSRQGMPELPNE